jgi:hypothetical protein
VARQRNYEGGRTGGRTKEEKTKRSGGAWQVVPYPAVSELKRADAMVRRSARLLSIGTLTAGIAQSLNNSLSPVEPSRSLHSDWGMTGVALPFATQGVGMT